MIREWTLEEAGKSDRLARFLSQFEKETSFVKSDYTHTFDRYYKLMKLGICFILIDVDENDDFRGSIGFTIMEDPNSPRLLATELFWFVDPRFRGIGKNLVVAFEEFAKERGCKGTIMTHLADSMAESLSKFYVKNGYSLMECNYFKEI